MDQNTTAERILYDAIHQAFVKSGWSVSKLHEEASQYGTLDNETVRVFLSGESGNPYETTISLLLLALNLEVVSLDGIEVAGLPDIPAPTEAIRHAHAMPEPANRIVFNAIINAWKAQRDEDGKPWSGTRLWKECKKYGHINNSTVHLFTKGRQNMRENRLNTMLKALRLVVQPVKS